MKHTPGPWHVELSGANASHEIRGPDKEGIAYTGIWRLEHREEQEANAHLIALAPDLLWLVENRKRYERINTKRDSGQSVASHDKEFVAKYEKRERAAIICKEQS